MHIELETYYKESSNIVASLVGWTNHDPNLTDAATVKGVIELLTKARALHNDFVTDIRQEILSWNQAAVSSTVAKVPTHGPWATHAPGCQCNVCA